MVLRKIIYLFFCLTFLVSIFGCGVTPPISPATDSYKPDLILISVDNPKSNVISITGAVDEDKLVIVGDKDAKGFPLNMNQIVFLSNKREAFSMDIRMDGFPTILVDSDGNKMYFDNYTNSTVDISIYDSNDNLVQENITLELNPSDLKNIKQLYESLYYQKSKSWSYQDKVKAVKIASTIVDGVLCGSAAITGLVPVAVWACGSFVISSGIIIAEETLDIDLVEVDTALKVANTLEFSVFPSVSGFTSIALDVLEEFYSLPKPNKPPKIESNPITFANTFEIYQYEVKAFDPNDDKLSYSLIVKPDGMEIAPNGLITWIPASPGTFDVTVRVSDGELFDEQMFTIQVEGESSTNKPVILLSPSNGANVTTSTVQLSWNPVANATGYEVVYDTSSSFTSPIGWTVTTTYKSTGALKDNTTYYWRVRAVAGGQKSPWSSVWNFTKGIPYSPVPPASFTVTSYWNTTAPGFPSMTLSWSAVTGATGYEMWVRPSGGTSAYLGTRDAPYITFNSNSLPGGVRYTPGQTYYFKVRTKTASGISNFASEVSCVAATGPSSQKPNPPTGLSPGSSPPGPTLTTLTPTLSWSKVSNATYYKVYVSVPPYGTSNIIFENESVSGTSVTIPNGYLQAGKQYRWNVRACNSAGDSGISDTLYFKIQDVTPPPQTVTLTLYFYKNSLSGPALPGVSVSVIDGGNKSYTQITNSSGYVTITGTPGTWYFTATKSGYNTNNWSQSITSTGTRYAYLVEAVAPKPNPPTNLSPGSTSAPGPTISTLTPTLSWSKVSNADYYNLSVSVYPYGYDNIVFCNQQVYETSITIPSGKLQWGKKCRWNMRAYNSAGGYSDYSADYYFQTQGVQKPSSPTALLPGFPYEPGQRINNLTPTLYWSSVTNADYYKVYVSVEPYGNPNIIFENESAYGTSVTIPSGKLQWGKKYRWNVRAHNSAGDSDISNTLYFNTQ